MVKAALKAAVAAGFEGVDAVHVFITVVEVVVGGRTLRRLQDGRVRVDYSVEVPLDVDATDVADALGDVEPAELTSAINTALEEAGADMDAFGVVVNSIEAPVIVFQASEHEDDPSSVPDRSDRSEDFSSWDRDAGAVHSRRSAVLLPAATGVATCLAAARPY